MTRTAALCTERLGEPVTLPTGQVSGVVAAPGTAPLARGAGSDVGARLEIGHLEAPVLWLRTADAAALLEGQAVTARGVEYLVVELTPDGEGLTRVDLMRPGAEPGPLPEWRQWR